MTTPADRERAMDEARDYVAHPGGSMAKTVNLARAFIEVSEENERLVAALHPGPMPAGALRIWDGSWGMEWTASRNAYNWCHDANRYESVTGRKLP